MSEAPTTHEGQKEEVRFDRKRDCSVLEQAAVGSTVEVMINGTMRIVSSTNNEGAITLKEALEADRDVVMNPAGLINKERELDVILRARLDGQGRPRRIETIPAIYTAKGLAKVFSSGAFGLELAQPDENGQINQLRVVIGSEDLPQSALTDGTLELTDEFEGVLKPDRVEGNVLVYKILEI